MIKSFLPELLLLVALGGLLAWNMNAFEMDPFSEFFHLESAKESLAAGRFWTPVLSGHDYLMRAPFWTWVVMLSFKILGVSVWAARVPALVCALLGLVFTYLVSLELTQNRWASIFSAVALACSWGYFHGALLSTADGLSMLIYMAFAWAWLQWQSYAARRNTLKVEMDVFSMGLGALLGLLFLVKGSVSVALLVLVALMQLAFNQKMALVGKLNQGLLFALALLVPLPWWFWISVHQGNVMFVWNDVVIQPVQRFLGTGLWQTLPRDEFFYLRRVWVDILPFGLLAPAAWLDSQSSFEGSLHAAGHTRTWMSWLLCWFALGLLVGSLSAFQEPTFLLPFYPPVAILSGYGLSQIMSPGAHAKTKAYENTLVVFWATLMVAAVVGAIMVFQVIPSDYVTGYWRLPGIAVIESLKLGEHEIMLPEAFPLWKFWLIPGPFILLIGGFSLFLLQAEKRLSSTPMALTVTVLAFWIFIKGLYLPIMHRPVLQNMAQQLNRQLDASSNLVLYTLQPDIKRIVFYLAPEHLSRVRWVTHASYFSGALLHSLTPPTGYQPQKLFVLMTSDHFFNSLNAGERSLLQVQQEVWKWDTRRLTATFTKFLRMRQPQFETMKTHLLYAKSISPVVLQAMQEEAAQSATQEEAGKTSSRRKRTRR